MIQKMKKSKGFTLIEMLVVIAIIAVLVSIIIPVVGDSTKKARAAADAANLRSFATTIAIDYMDNYTIDGTSYDAPTMKSKIDGVTSAPLQVWINNGSVEAYYVSSTSFYGVDYFSDVAENGDKATKTAETLTASGDAVKSIWTAGTSTSSTSTSGTSTSGTGTTTTGNSESE